MSNVTFTEFAEAFAQDLELETEHHFTCPLKEIPQYDSLGKINFSLVIERLFGFQIPYDVLDKQEGLKELYEYCVQHATGE